MPNIIIHDQQLTATPRARVLPKLDKSMHLNTERGFTLVELILVVALVGILATISLAGFNQYKDNARKKTTIADIRTIDKAVVSYMIDKLVPPPSLNDIGMGTLRDPWNNPFGYGRHGDAGVVPLEYNGGGELNDDYDLYSKGKDGVSNEIYDPATCEDDITRTNNGAYVGER